jgi:hypothetical protein
VSRRFSLGNVSEALRLADHFWPAKPPPPLLDTVIPRLNLSEQAPMLDCSLGSLRQTEDKVDKAVGLSHLARLFEGPKRQAIADMAIRAAASAVGGETWPSDELQLPVESFARASPKALLEFWCATREGGMRSRRDMVSRLSVFWPAAQALGGNGISTQAARIHCQTSLGSGPELDWLARVKQRMRLSWEPFIRNRSESGGSSLPGMSYSQGRDFRTMLLSLAIQIAPVISTITDQEHSMTNHIVVGVYDAEADAAAAVRDIEAAGVAADAITQHTKADFGGSDFSRANAITHKQGFWGRLFSTTAVEDSDDYHNRIERGSTVVTVAVSDADLDRVSGILESHSPLNVSEESAEDLPGEASASEAVVAPSDVTPRVRSYVVETLVVENDPQRKPTI